MITCFIAIILFTLSVYMFLFTQGQNTPAKLVFLETIKDDAALNEAYSRISRRRLQVYLMGGLIGSLMVILLGGISDFKALRKDTCLQVLSIITIQFLIYILYDFKEYLSDLLETDEQRVAYEELKEDMAVRYRTGLLIGLLAALVAAIR